MKLARPDVFHPRIVLAGCPGKPAGDADDAGLRSALGRRGLHARWMSWDEAGAAQADLVILRATHDYADRLDEFLAWTTRVANVLNPPAAVAWNAGPDYLGDLAERGVPTASARHRRGGTETSLIFLGGAPSHALRGGRPVEPDFEVWDVGVAALAAAAAAAGVGIDELLCARAALTGGPARLVELQLIDPSLGWLRLDAEARDAAQREFALAVESACERLGLGPFSHRGP
jgi:hypothetical protein